MKPLGLWQSIKKENSQSHNIYKFVSEHYTSKVAKEKEKNDGNYKESLIVWVSEFSDRRSLFH